MCMCVCVYVAVVFVLCIVCVCVVWQVLQNLKKKNKRTGESLGVNPIKVRIPILRLPGCDYASGKNYKYYRGSLSFGIIQA